MAKQIFDEASYNFLSNNCQDFADKLTAYAVS